MTVRDYCMKTASRFRWLTWSPALLFFVVGPALFFVFGESVILPIAFFAALLAYYIIYRRLESRFRCPFCGARLSRVLPSIWMWNLSDEAKNVARCGRGTEEKCPAGFSDKA